MTKSSQLILSNEYYFKPMSVEKRVNNLHSKLFFSIQFRFKEFYTFLLVSCNLFPGAKFRNLLKFVIFFIKLELFWIQGCLFGSISWPRGNYYFNWSAIFSTLVPLLPSVYVMVHFYSLCFQSGQTFVEYRYFFIPSWKDEF